MDLTTGWDFTRHEHREAAREYRRTVKPRLLIGSPMCTMFSTLQNLFKKSRTEERELKYVEAVEHIRFVVSSYGEQLEDGLLFLHEHPHGASSWDLEEMKKLEKETGVKMTVADQCM